MGRLKRTLEFLKADPDMAREIINQLEGTLSKDPNSFTEAAQFKEELINGYLTYYLVECNKTAVKDGGDLVKCNMYLYAAYNLFTKKEVTDQLELEAVRNGIREKYGETPYNPPH